MSDNILKGHNALITGASRGLGKAMALALGAAGAGIALVGRDRQALDPDDAAELLLDLVGQLVRHRCDLP